MPLARQRSRRGFGGRQVAVPERDAGTAVGHPLRRRQPDTGGSAGDHCKSPLEIDPVHARSCFFVRCRLAGGYLDGSLSDEEPAGGPMEPKREQPPQPGRAGAALA
jgi:hypothetical protein